MLKKFSMLAATGLFVGVLAGCGPKLKGVPIKVWQPQQEQTILKQMGDAFIAAHPEWEFHFVYGVVEEPDLKSTLTLDVAAGADVFAFPDDQLVDLVNAGALAEVQQFKQVVTDRNVAWSVTAATVGSKLYAYPETADNGYFLYYDSSQLTATDVASMDALLAKAESLNKSILFDPAGGWQSGAFFIHEGNTLAYDGTTQICDWNNAAGLASAQGMMEVYGNPRVLTSGTHATLYADKSIIASVTGTWEATNISDVLGDNYAATKLPTFTNGNNEQQQLGSFTGAKLVGVNALSENLEIAHAFAEYITNEQNQLLRAETRGLGPSNINAGKSDALASNIALGGLAAQSPYGILQSTSVGGSYWTPMGAFTGYMIDHDSWPNPDLQTLLDMMVGQITASESE